MFYLICFLLSFFIALFASFAVKKIALRYGIVDVPNTERKLHQHARPLLGGIALYCAFFIVLFGAYFFYPSFFENITWFQMLALFYGGTLLMLGGYLDDRLTLAPRFQILFPILAALMVLAGGVHLTHITNPFGSPFDLRNLGIIGVYAFVFLWIMSMMYTTKILDGVDGLVGGITSIGALMIFLLTQTAGFFQPDISLISLIFIGACLGFLVLNFPPAKLFLGEGGSLFTGFILGNLAIISGGKIATALLVMGLPIIDFAYIIFRRVRSGKSIARGDAEHLHFQLLRKGLTPRRLILCMYVIAAAFGASTLVLKSSQKIIALIILACASFLLIRFARRK